jgi:sugar phosphate isomerase/epimerase
MPPNRRDFLAGAAALLASAARAAAPPAQKSPLGIVIHSYPSHTAQSRRKKEKVPFADPLRFLAHAHGVGAAGVQVAIGTRDDEYVGRVRRHLDGTGMYLEGIVRLPRDRADLARFEAELRTAKACGVAVLRTVCLSGRRYETFRAAADFRRFARDSLTALQLAEPAAARVGVLLAIENHKDWRIDELLDLLKRLSSRHLGVCLDTGNSIALLEEPHAVVEAYAAQAVTTHFKDMAVAECPDGFLLSEVPLGTGYLDLKKIVAVLRKARPSIHLNLEMITRDPLTVPCLRPDYWATLAAVPAPQLAEALRQVRRHAARQPLPRVSHLKPDARLAVEEANVRTCLAYAARTWGTSS